MASVCRYFIHLASGDCGEYPGTLSAPDKPPPDQPAGHDFLPRIPATHRGVRVCFGRRDRRHTVAADGVNGGSKCKSITEFQFFPAHRPREGVKRPRDGFISVKPCAPTVDPLPVDATREAF